MKQFITLTEHAKDRSIRRYGIAKDKLIELAQKAIMEGYSTGDAPNEEVRSYLQGKTHDGNKPYVYSGYIFIFSPELVLITTFRMPYSKLMSL